MTVSSAHQSITYEQALALSRDSSCWDSHETAVSQRKLVDVELAQWLSHSTVPPFDVFAQLIKKTGCLRQLLDVGCGVGHYSQVLGKIQPSCQYLGCDKSEAMAREAKLTAPLGSIFLADGTELPWPDSSIDCVVEGCVIVHELQWRQLLRECRRVSAQWVMLHRTPYVIEGETAYYRKLAYGKPVLAIHYKRDEVEAEMESGFNLFSEKALPCETHYRMSSTLWKRTSR